MFLALGVEAEFPNRGVVDVDVAGAAPKAGACGAPGVGAAPKLNALPAAGAGVVPPVFPNKLLVLGVPSGAGAAEVEAPNALVPAAGAGVLLKLKALPGAGAGVLPKLKAPPVDGAGVWKECIKKMPIAASEKALSGVSGSEPRTSLRS